MGDFRKVLAAIHFPTLEEEVLELWDETNAFTRSVEERSSDRQYVFYDGPPFPTGSPHYGNLLAGVIKDIIPRYWTMRGFRVERRFGWDTHGLPIEMEVEKALGISGPRQISEYGIGPFNEACRALVQTNTENWETVTRRLGRWIDFRNDYKTMDLPFMETVWWVFKRLWDSGWVYKAFKVLPYSWGATTPLSNFEVNLGGYRDVDDPSVTIRLRLIDSAGSVHADDYLLVWTTTPWTLPGNLAVAVGEEIEYVRVADRGDHYWVADDRLAAVWPQQTPAALARARGSELLGLSYEPPFDYFAGERDRGAFRIIASPAVATDEGTGLVHMAPAYGEADFAALQAAGLDVLVDPIDLEARFTDEVPDVAGLHIKEADPILLDLLAKRGALFKRERIRHQYPFCYRTDTPLIYKAIPTWFVKVESFRDRMTQVNESIHWVPAFVGDKRFGNWLADARDWAVSRNRYWGSCIPVWECDQCDRSECIGSIDELAQRSGKRPADLHKHTIDPITWVCECDGTMKRVPEVLDCWFESGSMPYAQLHYPFENKEHFERTFPAKFIAEGLDQTRGWFYTLVVLSTALFDRHPFENCIVNGLILAEDGRKMSKSLRNYEDPAVIFANSGADALRAYLINSPVLRAETLRFSEKGVREVVRTVLLPLWHTVSFFTTYAEADDLTYADLMAAPPVNERAELDRYIISLLQSLMHDVQRQMEGYYLYAVVPPILDFIDDLTNWYVRRSRRRFWRSRSQDDTDKLAAFATLYEVLTDFVKLLAPILPFVSERIYQELERPSRPDRPDSVHLCEMPAPDSALIDPTLEQDMSVVRTVVNLGHALRKEHQLKVRQPLAALTVATVDANAHTALDAHRDLLVDELNVRAVHLRDDETDLVEVTVRPDFKVLGPRLGARVKDVAAALADLRADDIFRVTSGQSIEVAGVTISRDELVLNRIPRPGRLVATDGDLVVALDAELTEELVAEGLVREAVSALQRLRRSHGLAVADRISLSWWTAEQELAAALTASQKYVAEEVLATNISPGDGPNGDRLDVDGRQLWVVVTPVTS